MPVESKDVEVKKAEERKEVFVSFEASEEAKFEKVVVPDDVYLGVIQGAKLIDVPDGKGGTRKTVVIDVAVDSNGQKVIPLFASPIVSKARPGGTNSKCFDLIVQAGLLELAMKSHEALETYEGLVGFLDARLKKRLVKLVSKTMPAGYSKVDRIMKFEGVKANA